MADLVFLLVCLILSQPGPITAAVLIFLYRPYQSQVNKIISLTAGIIYITINTQACVNAQDKNAYTFITTHLLAIWPTLTAPKCCYLLESNPRSLIELGLQHWMSLWLTLHWHLSSTARSASPKCKTISLCSNRTSLIYITKSIAPKLCNPCMCNLLIISSL